MSVESTLRNNIPCFLEDVAGPLNNQGSPSSLKYGAGREDRIGLRHRYWVLWSMVNGKEHSVWHRQSHF